MKLLVISGAFPPIPGGEADHTLYLCQHLSEDGLDVHLLTTKQNPTMNNQPFRVYPLIHDWSWRECSTLVKFVRRCAPDGILLLYSPWIYNDHPMITFAPTICKAFFPSVPFVTQFDFVEGSGRYSVPTRAVRRIIKQWAGQENVDYLFGTLLRDSDRIIVLSEHHLNVLSERFPIVSDKSVLIPPAPLMRIWRDGVGELRQRGRECLGVKSTEFLLAFFGYVRKYKGLETLFEALKIVSHYRHDLRIVMIGGAAGSSAPFVGKHWEKIAEYENGIRRLIQELDLADRIIWTKGYTSESEDASLYLRAADACVLPFDRGIALNRSSFAAAAAHGLPVIATKGEVLEPPFIDGKNVILCPPKDPRALAAAIDLLIDNPELRQKLQAGALELAQEWFSWDKTVKHTVEALKGRGCGSGLFCGPSGKGGKGRFNR